MSYAVSDLKNDLASVLHGTTLNQVQNVNQAINRAGRKLLTDVDLAETIRIQDLTSPIFDRIYDYAIPDDLKGDRVIDIRPQVNRTVMDRFLQTYNEPFDAYKADAPGQPLFTLQWNTGIKSIRIEKALPFGALVNGVTAVTGDNGTWSGNANVANLSTSYINFVYAGSSVTWDVGASTNPADAYIENSTMDAVDLSVQEEQGFLFCYAYFPTPLAVNNVTLSWGSSSSDYWSRTVSVTQFNNAFQLGWNLLQFNWHGATVTGSPDASSITYLKFNVNYDGTADVAYYLNDITCQLGSIYQIEYYSKFLFRDAITGAFQENVTSDSNLINLDTDSYNLLFNITAFFTAQQVQGADSQFDASYWQNEYATALERYKSKIKSQVLMPMRSYYQVRNNYRATLTRWSSS